MQLFFAGYGVPACSGNSNTNASGLMAPATPYR